MNSRRLIGPPEECLIDAHNLAFCGQTASVNGQTLLPDVWCRD